MKIKFLLIVLVMVISCKDDSKYIYRFDPDLHSTNELMLTEIAPDIRYIVTEINQ